MRQTLVLALAITASAFTQTEAASAPKQKAAKKEFREPTWLMSKVEGPNLHYRTFDSKTAGEKVSYLIEKNLDKIRGHTAVRVVVGGKDGLKGTNTKFHEKLESLGVRHEFHVIPDAIHSPNPLYDGLGDENWSFFTAAIARKNIAPAPFHEHQTKPPLPAVPAPTAFHAGLQPDDRRLADPRATRAFARVRSRRARALR